MLALVVVPLNLFHVQQIATISPLDELMHIDYLVRGSGPGFLRMSDTFTQEAMDEISCRRHPTQPLPPCGARPYDPEQYSWKGHNLASSHSPHYYVLTGVAARVLRAVLPGDSIVTWARVLGSAWLLAGLALILACARRLSVSPWATVPFLAVLALSPATQHAATTVNPDATSVFAGGVVLYTTLRALQRDGPGWFVLGSSVVAMLLDPGNLLAILAALGTVLFVSGPHLRDRLRLVPPLVGGVLVGEVANRALLAWLGVADYTGNPQDVLFSISGLTGPMVWGESSLLAMVPPTKGYLFPPLETNGHLVAVAFATLAAVAAVVAVAADSANRVATAMARSGLLALVLGGPFLVLTRFLLSSSYFPVPARYGLSILPIIGLSGGLAFRHLPSRIVLWALAFALGATMVVALA